MDSSAFKFLDHLGRDLLIAAFSIAAIAGAGAYVAGRHLGGSETNTVGVRLTKEQQILRKNGAVCDAFLKQAFDQSLKDGKVVNLKLPPNPAQSCPSP